MMFDGYSQAVRVGVRGLDLKLLFILMDGRSDTTAGLGMATFFEIGNLFFGEWFIVSDILGLASLRSETCS
jgi:hypothetical protein